MEGEAGGGEDPGGVVAGEALEAGGLGVRQPHWRDARRAGQPGGDGQRRVAGVDLQVSGVGLACRRRRRGRLRLAWRRAG